MYLNVYIFVHKLIYTYVILIYALLFLFLLSFYFLYVCVAPGLCRVEISSARRSSTADFIADGSGTEAQSIA